MLVYRENKSTFQSHVVHGEIEQKIADAMLQRLHRRVAQKELDAYWNSLTFMSRVIDDPVIPDSAGIAIELQIPQTSKRIDFIISGQDEHKKGHVVIVELKQWTSAELTPKDGVVKTALGRGLHETAHPSYQAYSYASLLRDFSETVEREDISLRPCAYLHNYLEDDVIRHPFYQEYLDRAPVFLKKDQLKLRAFISQFIKTGDNGEMMYRIDQGRIRPSKFLIDALSGMMAGRKEFVLLDEQKLVYETALDLTTMAQSGPKQVLIVEGGPGTGKSVIAINLLNAITKKELITQYVTKNAAPRAVFQSVLTRSMKKNRFSALFQGSGRFIEAPKNAYDLLIVDEAHRLNEKSGLYGADGDNQIKEIIHASKGSVFFIDEDQRVTLKDIGSKDEIRKWATLAGADVTELELVSQFRCNGSDGYMAFLDHLLQIRETANQSVSGLNFDFRVLDTPSDLRDLIFEKNKEANRARLVAGYCWDWVSKNNPRLDDIVFPEFGFSMKWNLSVDSSLWIVKHDSVNEIGCIHTCQGLEVDYVGVIIGPDLIVRDGTVLVDPAKRSKMDKTLFGYKKLVKEHGELAKEKIRSIIKNTYRTLMTRGIKGCYVYAVDVETNEYLKKHFRA
ncbi:MAG: DUF2075 domain-containing protein [Bacteroidetes bacterium]|nr:DUF2075 domain-containing protein [Bacteroidota bacterium]